MDMNKLKQVEDPSKLPLKERLALRATQGKIDQYLNIIGNKPSTIQPQKETPNSNSNSTEDFIVDLLGNKRNTSDDLEIEMNNSRGRVTPDKRVNEPIASSELTNSRSKRAISKKKIINDDDDEFDF